MRLLFLEWLFIDSSIRGQDPVKRILWTLYETLWVGHALLLIVCILIDENYFKIYALLLKMAWDCWGLMIVWAVSHWHIVQTFIWHVVFGGDGSQYVN